MIEVHPVTSKKLRQLGVLVTKGLRSNYDATIVHIAPRWAVHFAHVYRWHSLAPTSVAGQTLRRAVKNKMFRTALLAALDAGIGAEFAAAQFCAE